MFVVAHTVEFIETKREMPTPVIVHVACIRSGYELGRKEPVTDSSNTFAPRNLTGSDLKSLENSILVKENSIWAKISKGYGVASGNANDHRFPGGTISMQIPFFYSKGWIFPLFTMEL